MLTGRWKYCPLVSESVGALAARLAPHCRRVFPLLCYYIKSSSAVTSRRNVNARKARNAALGANSEHRFPVPLKDVVNRCLEFAVRVQELCESLVKLLKLFKPIKAINQISASSVVKPDLYPIRSRERRLYRFGELSTRHMFVLLLWLLLLFCLVGLDSLGGLIYNFNGNEQDRPFKSKLKYKCS